MGKQSRAKSIRKQVRNIEHQVRLPLVDALVDVRADLLEIVYTSGLSVLEAMLEEDREHLCGSKHARVAERQMVRGGTTTGEVVMGVRRVKIRRPRVRRLSGGEVSLPTYEKLGGTEPLDMRTVEQMLIGVSTRKYERSLDALPADNKARALKKSSVSRRFVARTKAALEEWQSQPLDKLDIVALLVDGIGFGEHTLVVAMGIDSTGQKFPLGLREGSTENAILCKALLADLVARGLPADQSTLFVIDGGKGLRRAIKEVFGSYAVVQRCQVHKKRNILGHLPEQKRPQVSSVLEQAYNAESVKTAKAQLKRLGKSLEKSHPGAAASLREGLDESLTVLTLGIGPTLRRSLATTNAIESMFVTVRRVSFRVTRWSSGQMALRWALAGIQEAEKKFRRLNGKHDMSKLVATLRQRDTVESTQRRAA